LVEGGRIRTTHKAIKVEELKDIEFRAWLEKGSVVKSLERLESGLDDGHSNLEEAFADDAFAALLNILIDFKNDAISFLRQYARFLEGQPPANSSDDWPELIQLKNRFLKSCPDFKDFSQSSGSYWELEREYKNRIISAVENVAASNLSDIAAGESILEILTFGKGLNIKSGLPLGWQALDKVKKSEQAKRDAYFSAIGQLSRSKAPLSDAITTAGKSLTELKADGLTALTKGVILSNILCTIGCIRPDEACFATVFFLSWKKNGIGNLKTISMFKVLLGQHWMTVGPVVQMKFQQS